LANDESKGKVSRSVSPCPKSPVGNKNIFQKKGITDNTTKDNTPFEKFSKVALENEETEP
jgi:hypothetical protein